MGIVCVSLFSFSQGQGNEEGIPPVRGGGLTMTFRSSIQDARLAGPSSGEGVPPLSYVGDRCLSHSRSSPEIRWATRLVMLLNRRTTSAS